MLQYINTELTIVIFVTVGCVVFWTNVPANFLLENARVLKFYFFVQLVRDRHADRSTDRLTCIKKPPFERGWHENGSQI